ncbi:MAG: Flp family type IVb pilin [Reyranella sp.]|nr:Flp family type IVb pilin [Reyranella sp.]MBL6652414.1 Flp family type IVb pilin [Reyranella sp.]
MPLRPPSVVQRLMKSCGGATVIEYSVLVALISIAAAAALNTTGQSIQNVLNAASNALF